MKNKQEEPLRGKRASMMVVDEYCNVKPISFKAQLEKQLAILITPIVRIAKLGGKQ